MTDKSAVRSVVHDVRRDVAPVDRDVDNRRVAAPTAKIMLLPGRFRGADYVRRHVSYVLTRPAEQGERHVQDNLREIRRLLDEIGVDKREADQEIRTIEAAVRREIWRQVLTP
ncbi:DUF6074 family protein [Bradyrhizobium sp. 6(2017)]|uniref:DUF6074 family protein n=1 Tax=Bradyrhizobium sp. 6(2017) TaxID=1197460 RepID=UPI0013E11DCB|nr:DUF6074 family protein [Bradyrhizobium sp. 6(2017)]QIG96294.1 hypothetical protein G6P99_30430 [Bradyrhizobium sp. 6(2017)]